VSLNSQLSTLNFRPPPPFAATSSRAARTWTPSSENNSPSKASRSKAPPNARRATGWTKPSRPAPKPRSKVAAVSVPRFSPTDGCGSA